MAGRFGRRLRSLLVVSLLAVTACTASGDSGAPSATTLAAPGASAGSTAFGAPDADGIDDFLASCPSATDVAFVREQFDLQFDADPTAPDLVCAASEGSVDLTRLQERAVQAFLVMEVTLFAEPLPWTDLHMFEWVTGAIDGIRFRDDIDESYCCEPDRYVNVAIADLPGMESERWIDPSTGTGMLDLVGLIVHQARHSEGFVHTCEDGINDQTAAELGAWGAESALYRWYADQADQRFFVDLTRPDFYSEAARQRADEILEMRLCGE